MYFENKKYLKALPYLLKYQTFKPTDNDAKLKIGKCYLETGRAEKAGKTILLSTEKEQKAK